MNRNRECRDLKAGEVAVLLKCEINSKYMTGDKPSREYDVLMSDILEDGLLLVVQDDKDVVQVRPLRDLLPCAARYDDWGTS